MTSAYHTPRIGPDGLCVIDGCSRLRSGHLNPRDLDIPREPIRCTCPEAEYGSMFCHCSCEAERHATDPKLVAKAAIDEWHGGDPGRRAFEAERTARGSLGRGTFRGMIR